MTELTLRTLKDGSALGFPIYPEGIPQMLADERCWIVCEMRQVGGKIEKPPMPGFLPKDMSTWKTFKDATKYAHEMYKTGRYDGCYPACIIPDGFIVVDLDNHTGIDNAELDALYDGIIQPFRGGFIERSVSGRGWHITGQAIWDMAYSLTAKSDAGIDIQIRQPGGYIVLTGNLHKSGQPQLVNIESFLPVLHEYFKESLIPDMDIDSGSLNLSDEQVLSRIAEDYPILHLQLITGLNEGPVAAAGEFSDSDNSNRLSACVRNVFDVCRDFEQVFRIITACPVGKWENRSKGKLQYNTPDKYFTFLRKDWKGICAKVAASKAELDAVEFKLDPKKEWAPEDRSAELPENEDSPLLSPHVFYKAAPDNMKIVLDFLTGTDSGKRELMMDYAIAAALSMAGLATGKARTVHINGHENFISPALIVLGASGTGKSLTTSFINKVNGKAVRFNRQGLKDKTTEHTTHPKRLAGYMEAMQTNPNRGFVLHFDEATEFFTALNANNHTYFSQYVLSATMERKKGGHLAGNARSDKENDVMRIIDPCFGILMASVEKTLLDMLDRKKVTDGTLSRFLLIPDSGMRLQARTKEQILADMLEGQDPTDVPDDIMIMYEQMAGKGTPDPAMNVTIPFEDRMDYVDYVHEMDKLVANFQDDPLRASFFQRFALHWSHLVGCLAMYENPSEPVIKRSHCDWAFKYILRSIQGMTHKLQGTATDAVDESDIGANIMALIKGMTKAYGRQKNWTAVAEQYGKFIRKEGSRGYGVLQKHLDSMAFAESVFKGNASFFVAKGTNGAQAKRMVMDALDSLVQDGELIKKSMDFGGRPGTFYTPA